MKKQDEDNKHYAFQDTGMIKGYRVLNETTESYKIIINHISTCKAIRAGIFMPQ